MNKFTYLLLLLFYMMGGVMSAQDREILGFVKAAEEKTLPADLTTGYYLIKEVNPQATDKPGGFLKAAGEAANAVVTPQGRNTAYDGSNALELWYVEVDGATFTIATANKKAAWQAPHKGQKNLVAYENKGKLTKTTESITLGNPSHTAQAVDGSCIIQDENKTACVHYSSHNLGSWIDANPISVMMFEFYKVSESDINYAEYSVTYNIYENNKKVATETYNVLEGASYPAVSLSIPSFFTTVNAAPTGTVSQSGSFDVKYTTDITGSSFDNAPAVAFNVNGKYAKTVGDETTLVPVLDVSNEAIWKIVGDLADGYKIYNVATGATKTLALVETGNNKPATMSADSENNLWIFGAGNAEGKSALHLKNTNMYLGDHTSNNKLSTWDNAGGASAAQSQWIVNKVQPVTYEYYIANEKVATQSVYQFVGTPIAEPLSLAYATVEYSVQGNVTAETNNVRVDVTENLPFEKTTDLQHPKWYAVGIHGVESALMWHYEADATDVKTTTPAEKYQDTEMLNDDAYFWCFKGDVVNGFEIYNKKGGTTKSLNTTTGRAQITDGEHTKWQIITPAQTTIPNSACFKAAGTQYLNHTADHFLGYYANADEGSSNRFLTPGSFAMNKAEICINIPENAVGGYVIDAESDKNIADKVDALEKDMLNLENAKALATAVKDLKKNNLQVTAGKYYRIKKANQNFYIGAKDAETPFCKEGRNVNQQIDFIWKAEAAADGGFYLQNANMKAYMGKAANAPEKTPFAADKAQAGVYKIIDKGYAKQEISENGTKPLQREEGAGPTDPQANRLNYWADARADRKEWYIIEATDVEVALHELGGKSYGTAYLPFAVSNVNGAVAHIGKKEGADKVLATPINEVPAETGVILISDAAAEKATLTIADNATADVAGNILVGTLVEKAFDANALILGKNNGELGFYKMGADKKIGANKAYIELATAQALKLVFPGDVTGIENVMGEAADANAPIYDLTGRRVMKAVKGGLYIQNGKKFIAQ